MPGKIFVSYRRDDDPNGAARVRDGLAARFGKSGIFMDVDNLLAGQRFDEELAKALAQCDVLVAVIGPRWLELLHARRDGGKRDYVREEIAEALRRKVIVIPVRFGREGQLPPLPEGEALPADIRDLVLHQKHDVAHERFGRDIAELIEAITAVRRTRRPELADGRPWRRIAAGVAALAVVGGVAWYGVGLGSDPSPQPSQPVSAVTREGFDPKPKPVADGVRPSGSDTKPTQSDIAAKAKDDEAKAKAENEAKRLALLKVEEERQQREQAAADTKKKAYEEAARKAEQEAPRLAALKAKEEQATKARAEAEAKQLAANHSANPVPLLSGLYAPPDPVAALTPGSGQSARDCPAPACPEMVVVPAGSFTMGSTELDLAKPPHPVTIPKPFAVGKYEVTFAEWDACVAAGGCKHKPADRGWGRDRRPVINVSWDDITKNYLPWLSRTSGKTYRLLTEAEWEYAARGGKGSLEYWWGNEASREYSNYGSDSCCSGLAQGRDRWVNTAPVGAFSANPFGLHDMHGNVVEQVEDCWNASYSGKPAGLKATGGAWTIGDCGHRVLRGGGWNVTGAGLRSADRTGLAPGIREYETGFRVGRTLDR